MNSPSPALSILAWPSSETSVGQRGDGELLFVAERTARKINRTRNEAKADVIDDIEWFYNTTRRHFDDWIPQPC
jgi:hypothetical protein